MDRYFSNLTKVHTTILPNASDCKNDKVQVDNTINTKNTKMLNEHAKLKKTARVLTNLHKMFQK